MDKRPIWRSKTLREICSTKIHFSTISIENLWQTDWQIDRYQCKKKTEHRKKELKLQALLNIFSKSKNGHKKFSLNIEHVSLNDKTLEGFK